MLYHMDLASIFGFPMESTGGTWLFCFMLSRRADHFAFQAGESGHRMSHLDLSPGRLEVAVRVAESSATCVGLQEEAVKMTLAVENNKA